MNKQKGFTLIELLIVIGILGILATGLLAAVDPFEQLKKGQDTNRRNAVIELHNSFIRYYATHGDLPWNNTSASTECTDLSDDLAAAPITATALADCVTDLETDGELKQDFVGALGSNADKIWIYSTNTTAVSVCFPPESKAVYNDAATKFDQDGTADATTCDVANKGGAGTNDCYWCAK